MDQLIDAIRAATAPDATTEAKAAGAQACRTILAALDSVPGTPIALPGTPPKSPLAGVSIDQVLDLVIARLTTIANACDAATAHPPATKNVSPAARQMPQATSRGLRVPAAMVAPKPPARSARPSMPRKP